MSTTGIAFVGVVVGGGGDIGSMVAAVLLTRGCQLEQGLFGRSQSLEFRRNGRRRGPEEHHFRTSRNDDDDLRRGDQKEL